MRKHYWGKLKIGSVFIMMGVCLIFIQGAFGCPIILFENHSGNINWRNSFTGSWGNQLDYLGLKQGIWNGVMKDHDSGNILSQANFLRFPARDGWKENRSLKWVKVLSDFGSSLTHGIIAMLRSENKIFDASTSKFLIYNPAELYYTGLDKLLGNAPGIDLDFIKTYLSGVPHGRWTLADILASDISSSLPVPEPSTMLILGTGLIGLACFRRKKR
jgi:hypothetical protein